MARPVDPTFRRALSTAGSGAGLAKALGSMNWGGQSPLLSSDMLNALGSLGTGIGGVGGLLGAYSALTDDSASDFQKAARVGGGALQAANAGSQLAGFGAIPGAGLIGAGLGAASGGGIDPATIASLTGSLITGGLTGLTGGLVSGAGGALGGAAGGLAAGAASGVGALVAVPAILGALTRMGSKPYDREGIRQLQLDALTPRLLGPSIASGETPDPTFINQNIHNVPLLSAYLGTDPQELYRLTSAAHNRMSGIHANETMAHWVGPDNRNLGIAPVQDPLAQVLNPENIPRWNPLYAGGTTFDEGGSVTPTLLQNLHASAEAAAIQDKNRREHEALGLPFDPTAY